MNRNAESGVFGGCLISNNHTPAAALCRREAANHLPKTVYVYKNINNAPQNECPPIRDKRKASGQQAISREYLHFQTAANPV